MSLKPDPWRHRWRCRFGAVPAASSAWGWRNWAICLVKFRSFLSPGSKLCHFPGRDEHDTWKLHRDHSGNSWIQRSPLLDLFWIQSCIYFVFKFGFIFFYLSPDFLHAGTGRPGPAPWPIEAPTPWKRFASNWIYADFTTDFLRGLYMDSSWVFKNCRLKTLA